MMSLTKQDLQNIENIVERKVKDLPTRWEVEQIVETTVSKSVDRAEARITMAMGLLQRDTFTRIDGLEERVSRLERQAN